jgi:hypothetical protein
MRDAGDQSSNDFQHERFLFPSQRAEDSYRVAEPYDPQMSIDTIVQWIRLQRSRLMGAWASDRSIRRDALREATAKTAHRAIDAGLFPIVLL